MTQEKMIKVGDLLMTMDFWNELISDPWLIAWAPDICPSERPMTDSDAISTGDEAERQERADASSVD